MTTTLLAHHTGNNALYNTLVSGYILPARDHNCRTNFEYERSNKKRNSSSEYWGRPTPSNSAKYNDYKRCRFPYVFLGNPLNKLAYLSAGECQLLFPRTILLGRSFYYCPEWSYADPKESVHYPATTSLQDINAINPTIHCEWYFRGKLAIADAVGIRMPWGGIKLTDTHEKILLLLKTKYPHIRVTIFKRSSLPFLLSSSLSSLTSPPPLPLPSPSQPLPKSPRSRCTKKQGAKRCPNGCRKTTKQQCIPKHTRK